MKRIILLTCFIFIFGASFVYVVEHGRSWRFVTAAVVSAMAIGYLFTSRE